MTRIPELEQELVAAAMRLRSPRRVLRPAVRVALAAAAVAVVAVLLVVEATEKDHGRAGQKTGTPPQQRGPKVGVDVPTGVRFSLEGRQLTVTLLPWAQQVVRNRVSDVRISATCGVAFAQVGPEGDPRNAREERTRFWPAGQNTLRFRFRGDISASNAKWCRVENPAVGHVGFVRFGTAPVRERTPYKRVEQTANEWARLFAAGETCRHMTQPACERMACQRVGAPRPIPNCTRPSRAYRRSFRGATAQEIAINGDRAAARFTNGEAVELVNPRRADFWLVHKFGENAGRGFFK